jgi:hypothetical protein
MKKWTSSDWISLCIISLIPISWVVQFALNRIMLNEIVEKFGQEVLNDIDNLRVLFIAIPISQLVTLATIVIPAIFIRKAVREGTTNMTLPVGENAKPKEEGK